MSNIDAMLQAAQQNAQQAVTQQAVTIDAQAQNFQQIQPQQQQAQYQPQQQVQQQVQQTQQQFQQQPQQVQQAQYIPAQQQQQPQYQQQQVQQAQYIPAQQQQVQQQQQMQQYLPAQAAPVQQQMAMVQQQPMQAQLPAHLMAMASMPMEMTMDKFMELGLAVDAWLKPDFQGMTIGDSPIAVVHVDVEIDMTEKRGFTLIQAIRYGQDPVRYDYTTDNQTSKDGLPWFNVLSAAYAVDPSVQPYRAAQIPMTVVADAVNLKNEVVAKVGTRLGYTTSVTGWSAFEGLYRDCQRAGWVGQKVIVRLTNEGKVKGTNKWGIVRFELLGLAQAPQQQTA
ncbi:MAG: hypothetical protein PHE38_14240 [Alishewanella agri]|nr:hypothetical protein [Alishewanella agri]